MPAVAHPAAAAAPLLEMHGLRLDSARQPGRVLLDQVDWRVLPGDFWVLGGLQGAGKSEFLTLAAGLVSPASGSFRLLDTDLSPRDSSLPLEARLRIGVLLEGGQLQVRLTVAENVALPYCYHHDCRIEECCDWVEALLEFTGTRAVALQSPLTIRRNWRLRAGLARALVLKPQLLLLDNPLSGLDPHQVEWWRVRLLELARGHPLFEGNPITVIATALDLHPWRGVARQFAILKDRRLVQGDAALAADAAAEQLQSQLVNSKAQLPGAMNQ